MAITLSVKDYHEQWQESTRGSQHPNGLDSSETIEVCPRQWGTGYKRWIHLPGIALLIHDYEFHDDLVLKSKPFPSCLEFGFQISGDRINGNGSSRSAGENFVQWGPVTKETAKYQGRQRILQVDIHLDSFSQLGSFIPSNDEQFPQELKQSILGSDSQPYDQIGKTTPAMHLALKQLLNCPYQEFTKRLYLESKCLELIALRLEQLAEVENSVVQSNFLQADDIERIHHAKEILSERLDNPPSVPELARQVGLNHYALKQGFHQVFDTTPFGYLRNQRLERGRELLEKRQMNIKEVARAVGYASQSRFCDAFKQKFGVTPRSYCKRT